MPTRSPVLIAFPSVDGGEAALSDNDKIRFENPGNGTVILRNLSLGVASQVALPVSSLDDMFQRCKVLCDLANEDGTGSAGMEFIIGDSGRLVSFHETANRITGEPDLGKGRLGLQQSPSTFNSFSVEALDDLRAALVEQGLTTAPAFSLTPVEAPPAE